MNYYAVRKGVKPGVYATWAECSKMVIGCPGARYKKFPTEEEAWGFVYGKNTTTHTEKKKKNAPPVSIPEFTGNIAFADGSYNIAYIWLWWFYPDGRRYSLFAGQWNRHRNGFHAECGRGNPWQSDGCRKGNFPWIKRTDYLL